MTWKTTPTKTVLAKGLGDTMARVFPHTGVIELNADKWHTLPKAQQDMILLHEMGHLATQSANEFKADAWAFQKYMEQGGSPKAALQSLTKNLPYTNAEQLARTKAQFVASVQYDAFYNNNPKAKAIMQTRLYQSALNHTGIATNKKNMALDAGLGTLLGTLVTSAGSAFEKGAFDSETVKLGRANAVIAQQAATERLEMARAKQAEAQARQIELANAETRRIENSSAQARTASADNKETATTGMPVWGWVLIGLGTVAALGTVAYFAFFKK
jgi:hypothetical protein